MMRCSVEGQDQNIKRSNEIRHAGALSVFLGPLVRLRSTSFENQLSPAHGFLHGFHFLGKNDGRSRADILPLPANNNRDLRSQKLKARISWAEPNKDHLFLLPHFNPNRHQNASFAGRDPFHDRRGLRVARLHVRLLSDVQGHPRAFRSSPLRRQ